MQRVGDDGIGGYEDLFDGIYNGRPAGELRVEGWRKPWNGGNGGACVEAKKLNDGRVAIRQSTNRNNPALTYTHHKLTAFVIGAKAGETDFLVD